MNNQRIILGTLMVFTFFLHACKTGKSEQSSKKEKITTKIQDNKPTQNKSIYVEIQESTFGSDYQKTVLTQDSLIIYTLNSKDKYDTENKVLSKKQRNDVQSYMAKFPLQSLKKSYYDPGVKDGYQMTFIIKYNSIEKEIYISNFVQNDLADLVKLIADINGKDHIHYNKKDLGENNEY